MIKPMNDNVLLGKPEVLEVQSGGIVIPESVQKEACERVVIALGPDATAYGLKVGDKVIREKLKVTPVSYEGVDYELIQEENIRGKLT